MEGGTFIILLTTKILKINKNKITKQKKERDGDELRNLAYKPSGQRGVSAGTQTAVGKINWRHRPEAGPPMKEESLVLRVGARRGRRIQEISRSNQQSTKDRVESQAIPRFIVWKDR